MRSRNSLSKHKGIVRCRRLLIPLSWANTAVKHESYAETIKLIIEKGVIKNEKAVH